MPKITIYHNPRCTKSRQTLKLLQDNGVEPEVVEYLKTPPSKAKLKEILKALGIPAEDLIRKKEYRDLELKKPSSEAGWIQQMADNPIVIERPIVVAGKKARLGRPPEQVLEIL